MGNSITLLARKLLPMVARHGFLTSTCALTQDKFVQDQSHLLCVGLRVCITGWKMSSHMPKKMEITKSSSLRTSMAIFTTSNSSIG